MDVQWEDGEGLARLTTQTSNRAMKSTVISAYAGRGPRANQLGDVGWAPFAVVLSQQSDVDALAFISTSTRDS